MKIFTLLLTILIASTTLSAQDRCTTTLIYHNYLGSGFHEKMLYHTMLHCNFELDPDKPNQLFEAEMTDTIIEVIDIDISKVDIDTAQESQIILQLFRMIEFKNLKIDSGRLPFLSMDWPYFFRNFGLLEGRTISGIHPKNGYCKVFVTFNSITRQDNIVDIVEILDLNRGVCGEIFFGKNEKEIFRIYFDNSVEKSPHRLKLTFLPKYLLD